MTTIKKILYYINLLVALILICCYISCFVSPKEYGYLSLLGFLYPFALVINFVFVIIWLFLKPKNIILSLIAICIRIDYIPRLVNYHPNNQQGQIKVLSYNIEGFYHDIQPSDTALYQRRQDSILSYINQTQASIVCLQDYNMRTNKKYNFHWQMVNSLGYNYFFHADIDKNWIHNCVIYSKYPIINTGKVFQSDSNYYEFIFADIKVNNQKLRVYNLHLASYMLDATDRDNYSQMFKGNISDTATRSLSKKLIIANQLRAKQLDTILPQMQNTQLATIIVGDFNDHPFSNAYHRFGHKFKDSFLSSGHLLGSTYNGVYPAYRIDYCFYSANRLENLSYQCDKMDYSDHYPILTSFNFKIQ